MQQDQNHSYWFALPIFTLCIAVALLLSATNTKAGGTDLYGEYPVREYTNDELDRFSKQQDEAAKRAQQRVYKAMQRTKQQVPEVTGVYPSDKSKRRRPADNPEEAAYKRHVMRELNTHEAYEQAPMSAYARGTGNVRGPISDNKYYNPQVPTPPVQDLSVYSIEQLETYVNELDLNSYASALTVDEGYVNHPLMDDVQNSGVITDEAKRKIKRLPNVDPEVPEALQPRKFMAPTAQVPNMVEQMAVEADMRDASFSGKPGTTAKKPAITKSAIEKETAQFLNRITADSLPGTNKNYIEVKEPVTIERGNSNNPFEKLEGAEPDVQDGVEVQPDMEPRLEIEVSVSPESSLQSLQLAYEAQEAGQYEVAIAYYKKVLSADPLNKFAQFGLGTAYQNNGQLSEAKRMYLDMLNGEDKHIGAINNILLIIAEESPTEALKQLKSIERGNPEFAPIPAQIGAIYYKMDDVKNAAKYMTRASILDSENLTYRYMLANMLRELGHTETAHKLYVLLMQMHRDKGLPLPVDLKTLQRELTELKRSMG